MASIQMDNSTQTWEIGSGTKSKPSTQNGLASKTPSTNKSERSLDMRFTIDYM